jgi:dihydrofolate reductase
MRKLVESTFVSLDGSIENPQNWSPPYWDDEHRAYATKLLWDADALLLGRTTYEGFAQAWPPRAGADEFTDRMNAIPKHVASNTLEGTDLPWNATVLEGDTVDAIRKLKDDGTSLLKFGTGELDRILLQNGLVDEFHLWYFPVIAGGQRLIDGVETTHLNLLGVAKFESGIVVHVLGPKA